MKNKSIFLLMLVTTVFVTIIPFQPVQANMLSNPNFNTDINGWNAPYGSIAHDSRGFLSPGSIEITTEDRGSPYYHNGYAQQVVSVSPGTPYFFRTVAQTNFSTTNVSTHWIHLQWIDIGAAVVGNDWIPDVTPNGTWIVFNWSGISPSTAVGVRVNIGVQNDNQPVVGYYDDVYFDTVPPPPLLPPPPIFVDHLPFISVELGEHLGLNWTAHLPKDFNPTGWQLFSNGTLTGSGTYTNNTQVTVNVTSYLSSVNTYNFTMVFKANHSINTLDQIKGFGTTLVQVNPPPPIVSVTANLTQNADYSGLISITVNTDVSSNITVRINGSIFVDFYFTTSETFLLDTTTFPDGQVGISFEAFDTSLVLSPGNILYLVNFGNTGPPPSGAVLITTNITQTTEYSKVVTFWVQTNVTSNITIHLDLTQLYSFSWTSYQEFTINTSLYSDGLHNLSILATDTVVFDTGFVSFDFNINNTLAQPPPTEFGVIKVSVNPINGSSTVFEQQAFVVKIESNFSHDMPDVVIEVTIHDDVGQTIFDLEKNLTLLANSMVTVNFQITFNTTGVYTFESTLYDDINHPWSNYGTWNVNEVGSTDTASITSETTTTNSTNVSDKTSNSTITISTSPGFEVLYGLLTVLSLIFMRRIRK
jgi:hypothetical protein